MKTSNKFLCIIIANSTYYVKNFSFIKVADKLSFFHQQIVAINAQIPDPEKNQINATGLTEDAKNFLLTLLALKKLFTNFPIYGTNQSVHFDEITDGIQILMQSGKESDQTSFENNMEKEFKLFFETMKKNSFVKNFKSIIQSVFDQSINKIGNNLPGQQDFILQFNCDKASQIEPLCRNYESIIFNCSKDYTASSNNKTLKAMINEMCNIILTTLKTNIHDIVREYISKTPDKGFI